MAATAPQSAITGLPRRLVQDGILSEDALLEAMEAAKAQKLNLVAHLVANELASARDVAVAASHEFGHNLSLSHDGTSTTSYFQGLGSTSSFVS